MFKITLSFVAAATLVASAQASDLTLDPIIVSASKIEQSLKNTTSDTDIITAQELEEKHITSVIEALRLLGNIPIAQSGGIGQQSSFFQRGFSSENTVVMIDGIRYNDPTTTKGQSQLEHLMVNDIERIEVIHGAQSGIWGANAVAGVINIITKKPTETLQANTSLEYGSYATTKIGANLSQRVGALTYYVGANQLKSNGISALTPQGESPKQYESDGYLNQTINAKLGYDLTSADALRTQLTLIDAKVHYDQFSPNDVPNEIHQINRLGNIGYRHTFNSSDYFDTTYAITTFDKKDPLGWTSAFKGVNKELNLLGTFHYAPDAFVIIGGSTLQSKDTISSKELNSKGVFATNTNRWEKFILSESIRRDAYDTFKDKTTGKIGAKYLFDEDITLSGNYGTAYRTPSLAELYTPIYGNVNLQPETTKSFDTTAQYKHLSLTYYNNRVNNLIGYNPSTYVNEQVSGTSTFKGYEVRYNNTFADILAMSLSYNRLFAKDKNGNALIRRPNDTFNGSLTYYPSDKLTLGTAASYIGTRPDTDYSTYPATLVQTGRYTLWNAFANYDITSNLSVYLKADNLTDKLYQEVFGYGTYGRTFAVGLNAKF
ncbi:TonB-dependent receptor [Sulfuricurvum sp.]|uniref:TonB-dependent receptor domain-containing protein n=1 Tax=Sulfuricurvum sp. TaxID=2025608 RepID=UPI0026176807|nr:TonB-dependent receptor [Sulfuricurvum sp.]MDD2265754.1 TonB-dependent receptor [Sulfuricurvum sp.]MDD2784269.1 TonB-dependent receptor [Sulfuricurvum sp.]